MLCGALSQTLNRPVLDQTGLKGTYTFKLAWVDPKPRAPGSDVADPSELPSIFTALQERLGLKLESRREAVEMLVVDHVERPTEN
jgi:uncharacterized protein (TIGR03435 family)